MRRVPVPEHVSGGIGITVTLPRWLARVAQVGVGVLLLLLIAGAVLGMMVSGSSGGSSSGASFGIGVRERSQTATALQLALEVTVGPGDETYPGEGWSVLFADGAVSRGRVVSGPPEFAPDTVSRVVIEFGAREDAQPVALRYDPGGELGMSVPLR
ncbi:MAG: hypothetical protein IT303_08380 [Dehalococcoidia bacterium]|nr:hypothetical protein [Dehalococcoidia bacterium]